MTIGEKLRTARDRARLTQEEAALRLGVSRQTVSNWENDRSYPDLAATITLGELYGLTLDELVKEDAQMTQHLKDTADTAKSQRALARLVLIAVYLLIWTFSVGFFWVATGPADAMGYALLFLWLILPGATAVVAFFVGRDEAWREIRWLMLLFFGVLYMMAPYATFSWANMKAFGKLNFPELADMLPGILSAALGMAVGTAARKWSRGRRKEEKNGE